VEDLWAIALSVRQLGASGGELLVPPRSSARMRLKEALSAKPPSLRILPASEPTKFSAPPSGEYEVQSLRFSLCENLNKALFAMKFPIHLERFDRT